MLPVMTFFIIVLLFAIIFLYFQYSNSERDKKLLAQNLETETMRVNDEVNVLDDERENLRSFVENISQAKESGLRNPTWNELKTFLQSDNTNKFTYNDSFDCSGFSLEIFKRARDIGFRAGIVEIISENSTNAHMLNIFETSDRGIIYVDDTGNKEGNAEDKIAYVEIGERYGTIELNGVKDKRIDCNVSCSQFAKEVTYVNYTNVFAYDYFAKFDNCIKFYDECSDLYNKAVADYNNGIRKYSHSEMEKWLDNLKNLKSELANGVYYFLSRSDVVKSMQVYW